MDGGFQHGPMENVGYPGNDHLLISAFVNLFFKFISPWTRGKIVII